MSRRKKILAIVAASLAGLLVIVGITAVLVLRSQWFSQFVKQQIVAAVEDASGGKAEIANFQFDWSGIRVVVTDFVLHGKEARDAQPLFKTRRLEIKASLRFSLSRPLDIQYIGIDQPAANVLTYANGTTNIPEPKVVKEKTKSDGKALQTIVDLAIGKFEITNGSANFNQRKTEFSARGQNLQALLQYSRVAAGYEGRIQMNPLILRSASRDPLNVGIDLPFRIQPNYVQVTSGSISTPKSLITIGGRLDNLASPIIRASLGANISLSEVARTIDVPLAPSVGRAPEYLSAQAEIQMDDNATRVQKLNIDLGETNIRASGPLQQKSGDGSLQFRGNFVLAELADLLKLAVKTTGQIALNGNARLDQNSNYYVDSQINARNVSIRQGKTSLQNVNLTTGLKADPHTITVSNLKLAALGGQLTADAELKEMQQLRLDGALRNFNIQTLANVLANERVGYSGVISGPIHAQGDLKAKGTSGYRAQTRLTITPGTRGVPVRGLLSANYNGATELVDLGKSFIGLPHSRLDLQGTLGKQVDINFLSRNLNDFLPAANIGAKQPLRSLPVALQPGGQAALNAKVVGKLDAPNIAGHFGLSRFAVEQRPFDRLGVDLAASPNQASISNGALENRSVHAKFDASVGLQQWSAPPRSPLRANADIQNANLRDLLVMAGQASVPATGTLNLATHIAGTVANPQGDAKLSIINGTAYEEPFDRIAADVNLRDQLVDLSRVEVVAGPARVDANGTFRHPRESFNNGQLAFHVASSDINLDQFKTLQRERPGLAGILHLNADTAATLRTVGEKSEVDVSAVNANLTARSLRDKGQRYGDLTADAKTTNGTVNYRVDSNFIGSTILATGNTRLVKDYPTDADLNIQGIAVEKLLAIAHQPLPVKGMFGAKGHVAGTLNDPRANVTMNLDNANVYEEEVEQLSATVNYTNALVDVPTVKLRTPAGEIDMQASFDHPANDFDNGHMQLRLNSTPLKLAKSQNVQKSKPGLAGIVRLATDMVADLKTQAGKQQLTVAKLNSNVSATEIEYNKKQWGDTKFVTETRGSNVQFQLDSDFAKTAIHGKGQVGLQQNYPVNASLSFDNIKYSNLTGFLGQTGSERPGFDALVEGKVTVDGPATNIDALRGSLRLSQLQLMAQKRSTAGPGGDQFVALRNEQPIAIDLDRSKIDIRSFHLTGRNTDINIGGDFSMKAKNPLNVSVKANTNLGLLQDINRTIYSSGNIDLDAVLRGSLAQPLVNGQLALKNASVNVADAPVGLSNANGLILLNGTSANIQNLAGEVGGGKLSATGFVGLAGSVLNYSLKANAERVRFRQSGISLTSDADINLVGTSEQSLLSGLVTIRRVAYGSSSDVGSILSTAGDPVATPTAPSGLLAGMRLDVRIRTSSDTKFVTQYAQRLSADANLNLRGTLAQPGMLGRVTITQGNLLFFNNTYTVNQGNITFFNPIKIEPVLDVSLSTQTQGVNVVLGVTGPVDNMKLTYRSDPPLQFQEIVTLLATGKTPTSDPTILANQRQPPQQSLGQMGASAIVGQAVANPLASRVQRVFGLNSLKIDPTFTSGSALPQARVSLQQQVTPAVTFTYTSDLTRTNSQIIRVEWAFSPQYSAVGTRDENGVVGVDLFVKKQFR